MAAMEECNVAPRENLDDDRIPPKKTQEPGIVYLSRVPPFMSVSKVRQIFGEYGEVGRIFLQPDEKSHAGKIGRLFTEGWIEMKDKKLAKRIVVSLNNSQIGGKKKSRWYDDTWNMKYLHRFKWSHLNERLAYEKAVHLQRVRTEITQVKKEASFHIENLEKSQKLNAIDKRLQKKGEKREHVRTFEVRQRDTEEEFLEKKRRKLETDVKSNKKKIAASEKAAARSKLFLKTLFSGGVDLTRE